MARTALALIALSLSLGCARGGGDRLTGSWRSDRGERMIFRADKTFQAEKVDPEKPSQVLRLHGTYELRDQDKTLIRNIEKLTFENTNPAQEAVLRPLYERQMHKPLKATLEWVSDREFKFSDEGIDQQVRFRRD